jgi:N-acyl-D-amino-acid deacylase
MPQNVLLIKGGVVFGLEGVFEPRRVSLLISEGRVTEVLSPDADVPSAEMIDASGLYVAPGFVDSHMHDEFFQDQDTVQKALIRQGVTTCSAGHCGMGPLFERSMTARPRPWLHLSYFIGNCALREEVGVRDRYAPASPDEIHAMCALLKESLEMGAMGLSLGLEYAPGTTGEEIDALSEVVAERGDCLLTSHIRYSDKKCIDSVLEMIDVSRKYSVKVQVSHLGSMTSSRTRMCIDLMDKARADGLDVRFDCYPYDAFCAKAGSAVFDDGFEDTWADGRGLECLEATSGRFKGQPLTYEALAIMRREEPMVLIVAKVMNYEEIRDCLAHPDCIIASDALYTGGGAHPRIAGTFPRAIRILREKGYPWGEALRKVSVLPADSLGITAGRLDVGSPADVIVFDPENFVDRATYQEPFEPPTGLKMVAMGGNIVLRDGEITGEPSGDLFARSSRG